MASLVDLVIADANNDLDECSIDRHRFRTPKHDVWVANGFWFYGLDDDCYGGIGFSFIEKIRFALFFRGFKKRYYKKKLEEIIAKNYKNNAS